MKNKMIPKTFNEVIDLGDVDHLHRNRKTGQTSWWLRRSTHGDAMLLCTVVSNKEATPRDRFSALTVDYREKFAAAGRYPGGFFKREARPSTEEIWRCVWWIAACDPIP